jgi:hypothetical protein
MVEQQAVAELKKDFQEWSGGFPPESPEQVTIYVDYASHADSDQEFVRRTLTDWMQQESLADHPPATS